MKKIILSLILYGICISSFAQDPNPDLFNQTWYLYDIYDSDFNEHFYIDGYQPYSGFPPIPQITPYVIIEPSLNFSGLGICNTFDGVLASQPGGFRTVSVNITMDSCGGFEDMDEPFIIGPFGFVDPDPNFFTILNPQITNDPDGFQTMSFDTQPFVTYIYRNTPILSSSSFNKNDFSIYPNPASDIIYISTNNTATVSLNVYSISGNRVLEQKVPSTKSIDVSRLFDGMYFLEIISEKGKSVRKFVKKQ